jgi:hypothetical protein
MIGTFLFILAMAWPVFSTLEEGRQVGSATLAPLGRI